MFHSFKLLKQDVQLFLLLYCSLCNVGFMRQNLRHLNRTHKKNYKYKLIFNKKLKTIKII